MDKKTEKLFEELLKSFEQYVLDEELRINLKDSAARGLIRRAEAHLYSFQRSKREAKIKK